MRRADRDRTDRAQAVEEAEAEDEDGRMAFQRVECLGEGRLGGDLADAGRVAETTPGEKEELVRGKRSRDGRC